jgi:hypothetical protein
VDLEEEFQDLAERDHVRIKDEFDRLGVRTRTLLRRIRCVATGPADP